MLRQTNVRITRRPRAPRSARRRRARAYTLFYTAYDQCRRAAAFLRWNQGDAGEFAPALHTGRGGRRSSAAAETEAGAEPTVAEPVAEATPGTAPTAGARPPTK